MILESNEICKVFPNSSNLSILPGSDVDQVLLQHNVNKCVLNLSIEIFGMEKRYWIFYTKIINPSLHPKFNYKPRRKKKENYEFVLILSHFVLSNVRTSLLLFGAKFKIWKENNIEPINFCILNLREDFSRSFNICYSMQFQTQYKFWPVIVLNHRWLSYLEEICKIELVQSLN